MNNNIPSKGLHITLWIAQVLLAGMFLMIGIMKSFTPINELVKSIPYAAESEALIRFIGISELLAAIGLLLPSILRIKPILTPIAAAALLLVMVLAIIFHIYRAEYSALGFNFVLALVAFFIAWGRFKKVPIAAKN